MLLLRTRSQVFQLAVNVLIDKSKDFVDVERIFDVKSKSAPNSLKTVIKVKDKRDTHFQQKVFLTLFA